MTSQTEDSPLPQLPPYPDRTVQPTSTNTTAATSSGLLTATLSTPARMVVSGGPTQRKMDNEQRSRRATSALSMDDIEAAQALEGLRSDFVHSPASSRGMDPSSQPTIPPPGQQRQQPPSPEPLLSLLTSSHPLLSSAINSSVSVYTSSKSYSPRFKYGAEFLERNIGSPVVKKVGSVGKKTGVEGGIRWALQRRRAGDDTAADSEIPDKRRKIRNTSTDMIDVERGMAELTPSHTRRSSTAESLPPYDDLSSPNYEELARLDKKASNNNQSTWQSRLMISTSGLGVAMSEESLRSLTYCLSWLRWANGRLGNSIVSLKKVLEEYDSSKKDQSLDDAANAEDRSRNSTRLLEQIQQVKGDILRTLRQVVDVVSKYAGGALPENARHLVRRHLTSLPQRFRLASTITTPADGSGTEADMTTSAQRVLVLAEEGLDMMAQVSGVVNDTLVSAESWCEKLRRPKPSRNEPTSASDQAPMALDSKTPVPGSSPPKDVEMTGVTEKC
ncbi:clock controled protein [Blastomyces gilchristii SLH14081]|uniref:Clock controled protein n=1 Tax=Blastomyces gilchristii (strain SLH14081) TaxID=559298 RepID=A0A179UE11_BLAGS|nr:clock controled protein [Blastomyces gilchristii SLH14081]EQL32604.1 hypothetical protein BDFG_05244 [Blastomyces dermatitidis ATCC 26199]OAT04762.1 clock controled protein [Blastomyces gilchristii SLH14081]